MEREMNVKIIVAGFIVAVATAFLYVGMKNTEKDWVDYEVERLEEMYELRRGENPQEYSGDRSECYVTPDGLICPGHHRWALLNAMDNAAGKPATE